MKRYAKLLVAGACLLGILLSLGFFSRRENRNMEELLRYANGPLLRFVRDESEGTVSILPAVRLPKGAVIRVTLDGSVPNSDSPVYEEAIALPEDGTTLLALRAMVDWNGVLSPIYSDSVTSVSAEDLPEDLLLISLFTDPKNLYDYEIGIMVEGKAKEDYIAAGGDYDALPSWQRPANYRFRGDDWVRDAYMEMYDSQGSRVLSRNVGISISGNASASMEIKSLKITANWDPNETDKNLDAELFHFSYPDSTEYFHATSFNKIVLKSGGQDRTDTFLKNSVLYPLADQAGLWPSPPVQHAVVYLNGEFYSYMYVIPHINRDYIANAFGLDKDQVEWIETSEPSLIRNDYYVGKFSKWDLRKPEFSEVLESYFDVDNLLTYYACQAVMNNTDSINNNYGLWRYTGEPDPENPYTDGRFRFVMYDLDTALASNIDNLDMYFDSSTGNYSKLLGSILKNDTYRARFTAILLNLVNSTLRADRLCAELETAYARQQRWMENEAFGPVISSTLASVSADHLERVMGVAQNRSSAVFSMLERRFGLRERYTLSVSVDAPYAAVRIENMVLGYEDCPYSGTYLVASPVTLHAQLGPSRVFRGWEVNGTFVETPELTLNAALLGTARTAEVRLVTEAAEGIGLIINEVSAKGSYDWIELKNVGPAPVDLRDYYISDKAKNVTRCPLPKVTLEPGEIIVLNCKNNMTLQGYLVSFNLACGEELRIVGPDGAVVSSMVIPEMNETSSYGISPTSGTPRWYSSPTKGTENP